MVLEKSIKLKVHSLAPVRTLGGGSVVGGFSEIGFSGGFGKESFGDWVANGSIRVCLGFGYLVLGSGFHRVDGRRRLWLIDGVGSFWSVGVFG